MKIAEKKFVNRHVLKKGLNNNSNDFKEYMK